MLYDPKWDRSIPMTLPHLIGWLESKDPQESYNYSDSCNCALAQYVKSHTSEFKAMWTRTYLVGKEERKLPDGFNEIAAGAFGDVGNRTFGAMLDRARAYATVE